MLTVCSMMFVAGACDHVRPEVNVWCGDSDSDADTDADSDSDSDSDSDTDTDTDADTDSDSDADTDSDSDSDSDTDTDADSDSDSDSDTDTDSDSDAGTDSDDTDTSSDIGADAGAETDSGSNTDAGPDTDTSTVEYIGWKCEGGSGERTRNAQVDLPLVIQQKWVVEVGGGVWNAPVVDGDGNLYVSADTKSTSDIGKLVSFNSVGEKRWEYDVSGYMGYVINPVINNAGQVFVAGMGSYKVHGVNSEDGSQIWEAILPGSETSRLSVSDSNVLFESSGGVESYDFEGNLAWRDGMLPSLYGYFSNLSDGQVFEQYQSWNGQYSQLSNTLFDATGVKKYLVKAPGRNYRYSTISNGRVITPRYAVGDSFTITAYDLETGEVIWTSASFTATDESTRPDGVAVVNGTVYYATNNMVVMISETTGENIGEYIIGEADGLASVCPVVDRLGNLVVARGNSLYYRMAVDGVVTTFPIGENATTGNATKPSGIAIGPDGTIYIGSKDGKLFAFGAE